MSPTASVAARLSPKCRKDIAIQVLSRSKPVSHLAILQDQHTIRFRGTTREFLKSQQHFLSPLSALQQSILQLLNVDDDVYLSLTG